MNKVKIFMSACAVAALLAVTHYSATSVTAKEPTPAADPQKALAHSRSLDLARQLNEAFIEVADTVSPAVVVIQVTKKAGAGSDNLSEQNPFFDFLPPEMKRQFEERGNGGGGTRRGQRRAPVEIGRGSGIVVTEDGYILTNNHVVEGADTVKVRFKDGRILDAEIKGRDPQSDLAVIKIKGKGLPVAKLGDSAGTRVGEFVVAIGAPFDLDYSVTVGHISAKGRQVIQGEEGMAMDQDFLQTDASINPGNSGGPLVNLYGEVIGVNSMIHGLHTGIGFAVPSNLIKEVMPHLIKEGKFVRSRIGVTIRSLRDDQDYKSLLPNVEDGVIVDGIVSDGPAAKSELKAGDVVVKVDGKPVKTSRELKEIVSYKSPGEVVMLDVVRKDRNVKVKVKTEAYGDEDSAQPGTKGKGQEVEPTNYGLTVKPITKELAEQYSLEAHTGLVVTGVERDSPAWNKGIRAGDVITEVNRQPVTNARQLKDAMKASDSKRGVVINYLRQGASRFTVLRESD